MSEQESVSEYQAYMDLHRRIPGEPEPAFEEPAMLDKVWGKRWGINNDVGKLRMVLVCRPGKEWEPMMSGGDYVEETQALMGPNNIWYWKDRKPPDLAKAQAQHDAMTKTLQAEEVELVYLEDPLPHMTKSVFTRDPAIIVNVGAIHCVTQQQPLV